MNWEAVGAVAELIGGVAVLVTLVYLAVQTRQGNKALRSTVEQAVSDSLNDPFQSTAATDFPEIYGRAVTDPGSLTAGELARYGFFLASYLKKLENAHYQYTEGNLSEESWRAIESTFLVQFQSLGLQRYWKARAETFRREFRDYVEQVKSRPPSAMSPVEMIEFVKGSVDSV